MLQEIVDLGDTLNVITLDPKLEQMLIASITQSAKVGEVLIEPNLAEGLLDSVKKEKDEAENQGFPAVIVVAPPVRPWLAKMIKQRFSDITILSYTEIPEDQKIKVFARIGISDESNEESQK